MTAEVLKVATSHFDESPGANGSPSEAVGVALVDEPLFREAHEEVADDASGTEDEIFELIPSQNDTINTKQKAVDSVNSKDKEDDPDDSSMQYQTKENRNGTTRTRYTRSMTLSLPPARVISSPLPPPASSSLKRHLPQDKAKSTPSKRQRRDSVKELYDSAGHGTGASMRPRRDRDQELDDDILPMELACRPSTQASYRNYQKRWKDWCLRKRVEGGDKVTREKFLVYMQELLFHHIHRDHENPHLSILPLRINATIAYDGELPSRTKVNAHIAGVKYLYIEQCLHDGIRPDIKGTIKTNEVLALTAEFYERARASASEIPPPETSSPGLHEPTVPPSSSPLQYSLKLLWIKDFKDQVIDNEDKWYSIARARLQLAYDYYRFNCMYDISDIQLENLYPVRLSIQGDTNNRSSFGVAIAHPQDADSAIPIFSKFARQEDVEICPVGCLALYLLALWSGKRTPPDFDQHYWKSTFLVFEHNNNNNKKTRMDDNALKRSRKAVMEMLHDVPSLTNGSTVEGGVTTRVFAKYPSNIQAENDKYAQLASWIRLGLSPSYLRPSQTSEPYQMAAILTKAEADQVCVEREQHLPPLELQRQIFPFVEDMFPGNADWIQWIDNIMSGQPESAGRPERDRPINFNKYIPAIRIGILLVYLRKVILQDAVALLGCKSRRQGSDEECLRFARYPVFKSQLFREFQSSVQSSSATMAKTPKTRTNGVLDTEEFAPQHVEPSMEDSVSGDTLIQFDRSRGTTSSRPSPSTDMHHRTDSIAGLGQQIQAIQSTLSSMSQFMHSFRKETRTAINQCVERSESANTSVGNLHSRITRMERSIQGLWSKMDDFGTNFTEQAMEEMETQHRWQGDQMRLMRRIMERNDTLRRVNQREALRQLEHGQEESDQEDFGHRRLAWQRYPSPRVHISARNPAAIQVYDDDDDDDLGEDALEDALDERSSHWPPSEDEDDEGEEVEEDEDEGYEPEVRRRRQAKLKRVTHEHDSAAQRDDRDLADDLNLLSDEIAGLYKQLPIEQVKASVSSFVMVPRAAPFDEMWTGWFEAVGEKPSVWSLEKYTHDWRMYQQHKYRQVYCFQKRVIQETLKEIMAAEGDTLEEKIARGTDAIRKATVSYFSVARYHDRVLRIRSHKKGRKGRDRLI
ncbi:hypothetical protein BGX33_007800 [Mortierella sp. NVP41]|nr:hypothetical protein BGX33_007800 [Mortierella sp. NVP41]